MRPSSVILACSCALALMASRSGAAEGPGHEFFETKIRPVLVEKCYQCHAAGPKKAKGGLLLDSSAGIRAGGDSGMAVVAGHVDDSLLVEAIAHGDGVSPMPPDSKLPDRVVDDFRAWIAGGAPMPDHGATAGDIKPQKGIDLAEGRRFWSFLPAVEQALPNVSDPAWTRNRIDRFVLKKLDDKGMRPTAEADRRTLIRRVTFDLTGLPPTPEEADAFAADADPAAYEKLVDRLLASPRYGERWGRLWLDVARYAEDNPTGEATCKPPRNPHTYRDWVIKAINDDLPYDEFVRRQLAADLMPGLPRSEVAATGFLGLAPVYHKEPKLSAEVIGTIIADEWDEKVDTVSRGILGLTVACARCHDHKFDPIAAADYYALAGVMASTQMVERPLAEADPAVVEALANHRDRQVHLELKRGFLQEQKKGAERDKTDPSGFARQLDEVEKELKALKDAPKFDGPTAPAVRDAGLWVDGSDPSWTAIDYRPGQPRDLPLFVRGSISNPGPIVPRRFLSVLSPGDPAPFGSEDSGRLDLADRIFGDAASLAARVIVNRVWGWHFGTGIVSTPSNFGKLGDAPTHPELLDDLAARFIASGWSLKWLHREIVASATYRHGSKVDAATVAADPGNRWLGRGHRRRLDVESWHDAILQATGMLDTTMGGPSDSLDRSISYRRAVYGKVSRQRQADLLKLFDFPDPTRHGESRDQTTTPLQQLYFLNSPFLLSQADALAGKALDGDRTAEDRVRFLYRRILLRTPNEAELGRSVAFVEENGGVPDRRAWELLTQVLLIGNEALFVD
ncbi:PSD1 and planctomycete cytochrome C domain-containing protein [Tundrisphaera sp. TA3]|uniref:PSD1 and planctomycete cytochrome C domain-containing protein n=1 Tax=Tundrisphaera sp. TA3 TaxID=3435775 RepID=UPI003EBEADCF